MRTTVSLDDDVAALIEQERTRAGETFKQTLNRLLRRSLGSQDAPPLDLPRLPGRLRVDIVDVSAVLAAEDDDHELAKRLV